MPSREFLNSWKEVAQYVGRSQRTVQRWERDLGFPVHRPAGRLHASVIALAAEIDEWVKTSPQIRPALTKNAQSVIDVSSQRSLELNKSAVPLLLCIDDDRQGLKARKAFLEARGFRVLTAESGRSGITLLEQNLVAIVVLDYEMDGLDGEVVARMIKRRKPNVPVVLLSGAIELPTGVCQLVDRVVAKGEGPRVLVKAIEHWVSVRPPATP